MNLFWMISEDAFSWLHISHILMAKIPGAFTVFVVNFHNENALIETVQIHAYRKGKQCLKWKKVMKITETMLLIFKIKDYSKLKICVLCKTLLFNDSIKKIKKQKSILTLKYWSCHQHIKNIRCIFKCFIWIKKNM